MKTWNKPNPKVRIKSTGQEYDLNQISEEDLMKLIKEHKITGFPIFFAYAEKRPDGEEYEIPLFKTWPLTEINQDTGEAVHIELA